MASDLGPLLEKETKSGSQSGMFHCLPEELKLIAIMVAMEQAPATRVSNNAALDRKRETNNARTLF